MFLKLSREPQRLPVRQVIPNLITTLSLCAGLASLHFSLQADFEKAMAAVFIAAVLDMLDGRAARLLRVTSRFGAVLDSLADFLSFGVAPALILHQWMLKDAEVFGLAAVMTFVLCSALRLARFTAMGLLAAGRARSSRTALANYFVGMPTPAAAAAVLIPPMVASSGVVGYTLPVWAVVVHTLAVGLLMISRAAMFSFKKVRVSRRAIAPLLVLVGLVFVMLLRDAWLTISVLAACYLATLPVSVASYRRARAAALVSAAGPAGGPRTRSGPVSARELESMSGGR